MYTKCDCETDFPSLSQLDNPPSYYANHPGEIRLSDIKASGPHACMYYQFLLALKLNFLFCDAGGAGCAEDNAEVKGRQEDEERQVRTSEWSPHAYTE